MVRRVGFGLLLWAGVALAGEPIAAGWVGKDESELASTLAGLGAVRTEARGDRTVRHFAARGVSVEFGPNPTEASMLAALGYTEGAAPPVVERVVFHIADAGFSAWAGPLPGGLTASSTRAQVMAALGKPAVASAEAPSWKIEGRTLTVRFDGDRVRQIEVAR